MDLFYGSLKKVNQDGIALGEKVDQDGIFYMSNRYLGETIDIHAGGQDLAFPTMRMKQLKVKLDGKTFSNYWVHNGYININNEKMSKSKGNFTVRDISKKYDLEIVRFFMLSAHYKSC